MYALIRIKFHVVAMHDYGEDGPAQLRGNKIDKITKTVIYSYIEVWFKF